MSRVHGERKQDYDARKSFESDRKANPPVVTPAVIGWPQACGCPARSYPHHHTLAYRRQIAFEWNRHCRPEHKIDIPER